MVALVSILKMNNFDANPYGLAQPPDLGPNLTGAELALEIPQTLVFTSPIGFSTNMCKIQIHEGPFSPIDSCM
jgi:hypothetical protein